MPMFPEADLFTLFYDPHRVSPLIRSRTVRASFLNPARRHYRSLLPLMPLALESFDLRGYDLVISSESGPAKGVLVSSSPVISAIAIPRCATYGIFTRPICTITRKVDETRPHCPTGKLLAALGLCFCRSG